MAATVTRGGERGAAESRAERAGAPGCDEALRLLNLRKISDLKIKQIKQSIIKTSRQHDHNKIQDFIINYFHISTEISERSSDVTLLGEKDRKEN